MLRVRTAALMSAALLLFGCDEVADPSAPLQPDIESLGVSAPTLRRSDLVTSLYSGPEPSADGTPAGTGPARADAEYDDLTRPLQQILYADTRVRFEDGAAYSLGVHEYIGNAGRVETTAYVSEGRQEIGEAQAAKQAYVPFLLDFGQRHTIWVQARVNVDVACGLSVSGRSRHSAWWQFFQGTGVSTWGKAESPSASSTVSQGACQRNTSSGVLTEGGQSGTLCYYYITYDVDTGEILSADFLYCSSAQGEML